MEFQLIFVLTELKKTAGSKICISKSCETPKAICYHEKIPFMGLYFEYCHEWCLHFSLSYMTWGYYIEIFKILFDTHTHLFKHTNKPHKLRMSAVISNTEGRHFPFSNLHLAPLGVENETALTQKEVFKMFLFV